MPPGKDDAKKAAKRAAREEELARQAKRKAAMWNADGTARNTLADFAAAFATFDRNGLDADLAFTAPGQAGWDDALAAWALDLTRENMAALYNAADGWAWKDARKKAELYDPDARYLVARARADGAPVAFVHWRWDQEGPFDVAYVFELQLAAPAQRKGLGKHLMQTVELMARRAGMH